MAVSTLCSLALIDPRRNFLTASSSLLSTSLSKSFLVSSNFSRTKPNHAHKQDRYNLLLQFSQSSPDSVLEYPEHRRPFLDPNDIENLEFLENFQYCEEMDHGYLRICLMGLKEMDDTARLLAESFAEALLAPFGYVNLLGFVVKQYLSERRSVLPHAATLVGFYGRETSQEELAGTVEISFNARGANASPTTPIPPRDFPYICNMTVKNQFRRKGIGRHLLKASEQLISQMTKAQEVYLHCRLIDTIPLNMYTKAGYSIVKTDSILTLLRLQRRKHLMCKKLPVFLDNISLDDLGYDSSS